MDFEFSTLYEKLSAKENLEFFSSLYRRQTRSIPELLAAVGLENDAGKRVSGYSKGMKSRLNFVKSLLYGFLTVLYAAVLVSLPRSWRENAAALLIFSDPAAMGLFFMGAIILLEKSPAVLRFYAMIQASICGSDRHHRNCHLAICGHEFAAWKRAKMR